jgi:hypothetical protein
MSRLSAVLRLASGVTFATFATFFPYPIQFPWRARGMHKGSGKKVTKVAKVAARRLFNRSTFGRRVAELQQ